jgi:hypothetical protein
VSGAVVGKVLIVRIDGYYRLLGTSLLGIMCGLKKGALNDGDEAKQQPGERTKKGVEGRSTFPCYSVVQ